MIVNDIHLFLIAIEITHLRLFIAQHRTLRNLNEIF